jgi:hypothetical protein
VVAKHEIIQNEQIMFGKWKEKSKQGNTHFIGEIFKKTKCAKNPGEQKTNLGLKNTCTNT